MLLRDREMSALGLAGFVLFVIFVTLDERMSREREEWVSKVMESKRTLDLKLADVANSDAAASFDAMPYEITFEEFIRLISEPFPRRPIVRYFKRWFPYEIVGQGSETMMLSDEGPVNFRHVYDQIHSDPAKQWDFADVAMDLMDQEWWWLKSGSETGPSDQAPQQDLL